MKKNFRFFDNRQKYLLFVTTTNEKNKGLMYRKKKLKDNEGMLFIYSNPQKIKMWMKNTYIPLDVLVPGRYVSEFLSWYGVSARR